MCCVAAAPRAVRELGLWVRLGHSPEQPHACAQTAHHNLEPNSHTHASSKRTHKRLATPLLLQSPLRLGPSYSVAAVNFLLDHTALTGAAAARSDDDDDSASTSSSGGGSGHGGGGGSGAAGTGAGAATPRGGGRALASPPAASGGHSAPLAAAELVASEAGVLAAVLSWTEQAALRCDDCLRLPPPPPRCAGGASGGGGSPRDAYRYGADGDGAEELGASGGAPQAPFQHLAPPLDAAAAAAAAGAAAAEAPGGARAPPRYCARHQEALCGFLCRLNLHMLDPAALGAPACACARVFFSVRVWGVCGCQLVATGVARLTRLARGLRSTSPRGLL